jgi:hypothetical protein
MTRLLMAFLTGQCGGKSLASRHNSYVPALLRLTFFLIMSLLWLRATVVLFGCAHSSSAAALAGR